ncbi:MAG TPA: hypothetical protein PKK06_09930 [Phycisphaerae bacterium]|nr:hypothetical protein [Phycisphaerae bacterium]HNU45655.1 hypothetical protein [Phycisphaerae bacterium]
MKRTWLLAVVCGVLACGRVSAGRVPLAATEAPERGAPPSRAWYLSGTLSCVNCNATAELQDNQTTSFGTADGKLTLKMGYSWGDDSNLCDYYHQLKLTDGNSTDLCTVQDTDGHTGSGDLSVNLNNGGNQGYYKKWYSIGISAIARDCTPALACQNSDSDSLSISLVNEGYAFDTMISIGSPSSVYRWGSVTVSGTAFAEPYQAGANWENVADGTWIDVYADQGTYWTGQAACQTSGGRWQTTFACPTGGWCMDLNWHCTATLRANQGTAYGASTTYKTDTMQTTVGVYSMADELKNTAGDPGFGWSGQLYNPLAGATLNVLVQGYNASGNLTTSWNGMLAPGATTLVNMLAGSSVEVQGGAVTTSFGGGGATTTSGGLGGSLNGLTTSWGSPGGTPYNSDIVVQSDPPPGPVDVQVTVFSLSGAALGSDVFTINPHGTTTISLPDDIPGLPASGQGTVRATTVTGEDVLSGHVRRENLETGAVSATEMSVGLWPKLYVPLVEVMPAWGTTLQVHNPTDTVAEVELQFYEETGAPGITETGVIINPHATHTFNAADYVAMNWRGSVEIEAYVGDGLCGSVEYSYNQGAEEGSYVLRGMPTAHISLPVVGDGIDWDALYCVHNPNDVSVSGQARFLNADGSVGSESVLVLAPHATAFIESNPLEPFWQEPWATFDFQVTAGAPGVIGAARLRDPAEGTVATVACLNLADHARTDTPFSAGWNLISIPADPLDPGIERVLALAAQSNPLEKRFFGYDQSTGYSLYPSCCGQMRRGAGYWLYLQQAAGCEYTCAATPPGDYEISLNEGWTLWGYPFLTAQLWDDCRISDGVSSLSPADAESAGWIQRTIYGYADGDYYEVPGDQTQVEPWRAYWLLTHQAGLTLVVSNP